METSAKDGNNVNKLFCEAGKILYNDYEQKNSVNHRHNRSGWFVPGRVSFGKRL